MGDEFEQKIIFFNKKYNSNFKKCEKKIKTNLMIINALKNPKTYFFGKNLGESFMNSA